MAVRTINSSTGAQQRSLAWPRLSRLGMPFRFYAAALSYYVATLPIIAAASTIWLYVIFAGELDKPAPAARTVLIGMGVALLIWLITAFLFRPKFAVSKANPTVFGDLKVRLVQLRAEEAIFCPNGTPAVQTDPQCPTNWEAARTAHDNIREIAYLLNSDANNPRLDEILWLSGTGYNEVYKYVHYADEALLELEPIAEVCAEARRIQLVIKDSNIGNQTDLSQQLDDATKTLGDIACRKGTTNPTPAEETEARGKVRAVSRIVHDYLGLRYDGLIRARDRVTRSVLGMGVGLHLLLALAMFYGASSGSILAAAIYFLVGAAVGFFNRLRLDGRTRIVLEEDYGWSVTQTAHTLLFSGLAAVGGVLMVAMLPALGTGLQAFSVPPATHPPLLATIFDIDVNGIGLLVAAIFGLTPTLFTSALQKEVATINDDLASLRPHSDGASSKSSKKS